MVRLSTDQVDSARRIAERVSLEFTHAAGPTSGATATVADALQTERANDFRHDLLHNRPDLLLLMNADNLDGDAWNAIEESGVVTASLEPRAAGISDVPTPAGTLDERVFQTPLFRALPTYAAFNEIRESFGTVHSVSIVMRSRRAHGSLHARLVDALDLMEHLCGPAIVIDASMSGPLGTPPETLRAMHGHITVNARFAENRCACIHVSDLGAAWSRGITVLGEGGCVRVIDHALEWWNHEGELIDQHNALNDSTNSTEDPCDAFTPEGEIAHDIRRILDASTPTPIQPDIERITAVCECVRLSLRTGQGESADKIFQLITG